MSSASARGAHQLVPIVVERPLWSERVARWQLPVYAIGVVGVIGHFVIGQWSGFVWSAAVVALAALAHAGNAGATLASAPSSFTARMVWVALVGLTLTALFGTLIGAHKMWPFLPGALFPTLHAHVHLALLGWVLPMVVGVAARVYPMFLLVAEPDGMERTSSSPDSSWAFRSWSLGCCWIHGASPSRARSW